MAPIGKSTGSSAVKTPTKAKSSGSVRRSTSSNAPAKAKPAAKAPQDSARVSPDAKKAEKPNAMAEGITKNWKSQGLETSEGNKLGKYTKGGEGTIEKELLKKGFSLKDIYTKDKQGRTLADQVAQTNGIKNQRQIADGKELKLPQRPGAQGVSSGEVKPGEKKSIETVNGANQAQQTVAKGPDGSLKVDQSTAAGNNRVTTVTEAPAGSTSHGSTAKDGPNVVNHNTTQSPDNQAVSTLSQRTDGPSVRTDFADADSQKNTTGQRTQGGLTLSNPDGQGGAIKSTIPLGPQSGLQRLAQSGDELIGKVVPSVKPQQVTGAENPIGQIGSVKGLQRPDGSADYTVRQGNGATQQVGQTPAGPLLGASQSVEETLGNAWKGIKNWFSGG